VATSKAKRRAAVRRARLATQGSTAASPATPPDVLVLDNDDTLRTGLCAVLEKFGFRPHPVRSQDEARAALSERVFVATFLHIALDGTDRDAAADLCVRARQAPAQGSGHAAALIIVGSGARPVERVRASMAGADQFLVNPASRGDVARALVACGVELPSDPRRG
jgi:DNA-binding response OmpR family regulator